MSSIRILFLTQICPYPPTNGGAIKTYNILKHLGARHDVSLLTFIRRESETDALAHLATYCRTTESCMIERSGMRNAADAAKSLLSRRSFIVARDWREAMQARVDEMIDAGQDLIYVDHLQMFQYVPDPAPCPVLLDEHNVEWRIIQRFAEAPTPVTRIGRKLFAAIEWPKLRACELNACHRADLVLTVTQQDGETLTSNGIPDDKIVPLPIGVDIDYFRPIQLSETSTQVLSFGTMSWPPNADAVSYFTTEIYPLIKRRAPQTSFNIIGANPPAEIKALGERDESIEVAGFVEDIRAAAQGAAVFVVPLRIGSGMRVKILDAMAMGLPVVTTSVGCEGIAITPGEHALVADTPDDFADAVVRLLNDPWERTRLASAGRKLVEYLYAWSPILKRLDLALEKL